MVVRRPSSAPRESLPTMYVAQYVRRTLSDRTFSLRGLESREASYPQHTAAIIAA
jgi:hypothetical protein